MPTRFLSTEPMVQDDRMDNYDLTLLMADTHATSSSSDAGFLGGDDSRSPCTPTSSAGSDPAPSPTAPPSPTAMSWQPAAATSPTAAEVSSAAPDHLLPLPPAAAASLVTDQRTAAATPSTDSALSSTASSATTQCLPCHHMRTRTRDATVKLVVPTDRRIRYGPKRRAFTVEPASYHRALSDAQWR